MGKLSQLLHPEPISDCLPVTGSICGLNVAEMFPGHARNIFARLEKVFRTEGDQEPENVGGGGGNAACGS